LPPPVEHTKELLSTVTVFLEKMHRLDAIGDSDLRETLLFARAQASPVTADQVAAAHRIHRNVARSRLERLADAGLLISSFERRTGRTGPGAGRPAKTYRVAPELSPIEFPERGYGALIGLIVDALPQRTRIDRLHAAGVAFGRELGRRARLRPASTLRTALRRACAAIGGLGYQASVAEVTGESAVITTATCPLRPLVRAHPELAELDRGMWAALLAQALRGIEVGEITCDTRRCHSDQADCRVLVRLQPRRG
jgi:predicted ArsR family transcriptional regulator